MQARTALSRSYFGEGLSRLGDKLYQVTYKGNLGFVYNLADLKQVGAPWRGGCSAAAAALVVQVGLSCPGYVQTQRLALCSNLP